MKSVDFPEANLPLAKDQPEYQTLYVHFDKMGAPYFPMTACFLLSDEEVEEIVRTRKLWFTQSTFGRGFSPVNMNASNPFTSPVITDRAPDDENRTPAEAWDKSHYSGMVGNISPGRALYLSGPCANCGKDEHQHFWSTRQCDL